MSKVRWFDLSKYGARLRVVAQTPLRGVALTCFEIHDTHALSNAWGVESVDQGRIAELQKELFTNLENLGFSLRATLSVIKGDDGNDVGVRRYFSDRSKFSFEDIKKIVPTLELDDVKELDASEIILKHETDNELLGKWKWFSDEILAVENNGVWTPKTQFSLAATSWHDAKEIDVMQDEVVKDNEGYSKLFGYKSGFNAKDRFIDILSNSLKLRSNALIEYYASKESALNDGWSEDQLEQVNLPFALPTWVERSNKITAVRDIRYVVGALGEDPSHYFGDVNAQSGLVVNAIREAQEFEHHLSEQIETWKIWANNPNELKDLQDVWKSFNELALKFVQMYSKYPAVVGQIPLDALGAGELNVLRYEMKDLSDLKEHDMRHVIDICAALKPMSNDELQELKKTLISVYKRCNELVEEKAKEAAKENLKDMIRTVRQESSQSNTDTIVNLDDRRDNKNVKHEDAGEKIGGARKDFATRAMTIDDIDVMNDAEREVYVLKKNVWPALNYRQMREDGYEPEAAYAIKFIKDRLETKPANYRDFDGGLIRSCEDYVKAITLVRDKLDGVKTYTGVCEVVKELYNIGRLDPMGNETSYIAGGTALQKQWGKKASESFYYGRDGNGGYDLRRVISRHVTGYSEKERSADQKWSSMIKTRREKTPEQIEEDNLRATVDQELRRPHLANVEREGQDWRGGRDVVADDLIEHFGFRAIEFGNWLPQDERQQVLNMAFDSMCDLSQALKIPPKAVSLDGTLAIAFGSRGQGGRNAARAHYEPARKVMNLTRLNGAGSLAHEWMHAFDNFLAEKNGLTGFLSDSSRNKVTEMSKLCSAMISTDANPSIIAKQAEPELDKGVRYAKSWYGKLGSENKRKVDQVIDDIFENFYFSKLSNYKKIIEQSKESNQSVIAFLPVDLFSAYGFSNHQEIQQSANVIYDEIKSTITERTRLSETNIKRCLVHGVKHAFILASCKALEQTNYKDLPGNVFGRTSSEFYRNAKKLDEMRSKPYWSSTVELFARAGASYVTDKLSELEVRSDYLVYGSDEERFLNYGHGNPNPSGIERQEINKRFDELINAYRLECVAEAGQEREESLSM